MRRQGEDPGRRAGRVLPGGRGGAGRTDVPRKLPPADEPGAAPEPGGGSLPPAGQVRIPSLKNKAARNGRRS